MQQRSIQWRCRNGGSGDTMVTTADDFEHQRSGRRRWTSGNSAAGAYRYLDQSLQHSERSQLPLASIFLSCNSEVLLVWQKSIRFGLVLNRRGNSCSESQWQGF